MVLEVQKQVHALKTVDNFWMHRVVYAGFNAVHKVTFAQPSSSPVSGSGGGLPLQPIVKPDCLVKEVQDCPVLK